MTFLGGNSAMAMTNADVAHALDQTLSDLITLDLVVRKARGNLVGRNSYDVHRLLHGLADTAREAGNGIAVRAMTLGYRPRMWEEAIERKDALRSVDTKPLRDGELFSAFGQMLETIALRLHANISASACDLVTQALLIGLADRLENLAWMTHARTAA